MIKCLFGMKPPESGESWFLVDRESGPWESKRFEPVKILDVKSGWVRYFINEVYPDERMKIGTFVRVYRKM